MIREGRGVDMGDGWETARHLSRPPVLEPGPDGAIKGLSSDWALLRLGCAGTVSRIEVRTHTRTRAHTYIRASNPTPPHQIDTAHFKGNFPESCQIDACYEPDLSDEAFQPKDQAQRKWVPLLAR